MKNFKKYVKKIFFFSMFLAGALLLVPSQASACTITVNITNPSSASSKAQITKLKVKVKGGTWRNIQQGGKRILSPGQTYTEKFKPTISTDECDARRRYKVKVKCVKSGMVLPETTYKGLIYFPGESGWTRNQEVNIDAGCP